ncbi:MAG: toll/interleukin-1 receptor domain-containing protein [Bryobacteraceae bacterium]
MKRVQPAYAGSVDFFISYTRADLEWARWITWELENENYRCCVQFQSFRPGTDFMQQMRTALKSARQTIVLLSPDYLESEYAQSELNAALRKDPLGIRAGVLPIRVRACEPNEILQGRIYVDLVGKSAAEAKKELLQGVAASRLSTESSGRSTRFQSKPSFPISESELKRPTQRFYKSPGERSRTREKLSTTVLFVASEANTGLDLRGQFRKLQAAVRPARHAQRLRFKSVFDATPERLFQALNQCSPTIVHFSGKQDAGNILMNSENGRPRTISDTALAGLLRSLDGVRLAIVDTCYSLPCAVAISEAVDAAMGVKSFIYEDDATSFYCCFHRALASGKSLRDAAAQAAQLDFKGVPKSQIPQLKTRTGLDAKTVVLFE